MQQTHHSNSSPRYEQSNSLPPTYAQHMGYVPGDVPSVVQSLLVAMKRVQESLRLWSMQQASETQVSDCYIRFGSDFNATVEAFSYYNIDTSDIHSVPGELRNVLENCLGEEPSSETLELYMPEVRQLFYNLLQGLRAKQPAWRAASGRPSMVLPDNTH